MAEEDARESAVRGAFQKGRITAAIGDLDQVEKLNKTLRSCRISKLNHTLNVKE